MIRCFTTASLVAAAFFATAALPVERAHAEQEEVKATANLVELLEQLKQNSKREEELNLKRERDFRAAKDRQHVLLQQALEAEAIAQAKSEELEAIFDENESKLPDLEETLRLRLGTLGEMFGVVRQVAGETISQFDGSIISAQLPGRTESLSKLAQSKELPSITELEKLWLSLYEEMVEQGRVVKFEATVINADGVENTTGVTRVGPFNAIADGHYLRWLPANQQLAELGRQPASKYLNAAEAFEATASGVAGMAVDPSRGAILSALIQAPSFGERIAQGGTVGYVIIVLGLIGFGLAVFRLITLAAASRSIHDQLGREDIDMGNALGRVISVYQENSHADVEALELRLDEAILRESSQLQRGATLVKVLSVIAPLLGLLGTVTGMILTFQMITLFGTGDPKLMAGGISQALVTTVLGLVMAIPLTVLHSMIAERSKILVNILEERSTGLVAERAEAQALEAARAA